MIKTLILRGTLALVATTLGAGQAQATPKAEIAKMQASLAKLHDYYCGSPGNQLHVYAKQRYNTAPAGPPHLVSLDDLQKTDPASAAFAIGCETGGIGYSPLALVKVTDRGPIEKHRLALHAYHVVLGSDATHTEVDVLIWPDHHNLPIDASVKDASGIAKYEWTQFDGVMAHE